MSPSLDRLVVARHASWIRVRSDDAEDEETGLLGSWQKGHELPFSAHTSLVGEHVVSLSRTLRLPTKHPGCQIATEDPPHLALVGASHSYSLRIYMLLLLLSSRNTGH
jgi:hypothetical protein